MPHDVFISHASQDKPLADALCATLERSGLRCWISPRDILPGVNWGEAILDAIASSKVMVLVFSSHSNQSPQVMREVERAVGKGLIIAPFRVEDVQPSRAMEYYISAPHWLDALTPPIEQHMQTLAEKLKLLLNAAPESTAPVAQPAATPHRRHMTGTLAFGALLVIVAACLLFMWRPWESNGPPAAMTQPAGGSHGLADQSSEPEAGPTAQPAPVVEAAPVAESASESKPVSAPEPEREPVVEPEAVAESASESEPVPAPEREPEQPPAMDDSQFQTGSVWVAREAPSENVAGYILVVDRRDRAAVVGRLFMLGPAFKPRKFHGEVVGGRLLAKGIAGSGIVLHGERAVWHTGTRRAPAEVQFVLVTGNADGIARGVTLTGWSRRNTEAEGRPLVLTITGRDRQDLVGQLFQPQQTAKGSAVSGYVLGNWVLFQKGSSMRFWGEFNEGVLRGDWRTMHHRGSFELTAEPPKPQAADGPFPLIVEIQATRPAGHTSAQSRSACAGSALA